MGKHDVAKREKAARNLLYATKHAQRKCQRCRHRSSKPGSCRVCGGQMK